MKPNPNRKRCETCKKPLARYWEMLTPDKGVPIKRKDHGHGLGATKTGNWSTGFYGRYGYGGNGFFCTLTCGYVFAVRLLKGK